MKLSRFLFSVATVAALAVTGTAAAPSASIAAEKDTYVMEDYRGLQADYFKESMKIAGIKVELKTPEGKRGKAKSDWVVVSTKPAAGKTVPTGKSKVSAIVRKEDETATGIRKKDTYLACSDRIKKEYPGARIAGGWKVQATNEVSTLSGPVSTSGSQDKRNLTCSITKQGKAFHFERFTIK